MPGKKFLYNRVLMSGTSKNDLETIHTYLSNDYHINSSQILDRYNSDKDMIEVGKSPEFLQFQGLFNNSKKDTAWHLYLHFIVGEKEVASSLSESLRKGYGADRNDFLADLTLAIGAELKDQESLKLITTTPISSQIQNLAKKCIIEINHHKLGVEGREILWDEIMARGKAISYFIEKASGHSYYKAIPESKAAGIKYWSNYVEPTFYCLSDIPDEISIAGASLNQE